MAATVTYDKILFTDNYCYRQYISLFQSSTFDNQVHDQQIEFSFSTKFNSMCFLTMIFGVYFVNKVARMLLACSTQSFYSIHLGFFNLCPTSAKFNIHRWHLPSSCDIGEPTAAPSTSHCLFPITNSIFCLTSIVRPFKLRDCINGFSDWYNKV